MTLIINGIKNGKTINNIETYKESFISKYGDTTDDYDQLDKLGKMKNLYTYILIFILAVIFCIISFTYSNKLNDPIHGSIKWSNILFYLGWFFVVVIMITIGYGSYLYFLVYLPEWYEWFNDLPVEAKRDYMALKTFNNDLDNRYTSISVTKR